MSNKLQDQMQASGAKASGARASGQKADIKRTTQSKKLDAPKTTKAKSNIGHGYQDDPNRPRAKK
ncbi:hypothetical protein [Microbulbifer guangxiensis]|uniref:hypothetical protein n=1 Tax=Microbulbifer guangxiensis TaxID=2904249 RepID=UPI001F39B4E9|nr:hypothetical protein [Microbulbifer guangxiensis]